MSRVPAVCNYTRRRPAVVEVPLCESSATPKNIRTNGRGTSLGFSWSYAVRNVLFENLCFRWLIRARPTVRVGIARTAVTARLPAVRTRLRVGFSLVFGSPIVFAWVYSNVILPVYSAAIARFCPFSVRRSPHICRRSYHISPTLCDRRSCFGRSWFCRLRRSHRLWFFPHPSSCNSTAVYLFVFVFLFYSELLRFLEIHRSCLLRSIRIYSSTSLSETWVLENRVCYTNSQSKNVSIDLNTRTF